MTINRTERKRKHAQTFSSFDDFLDEDEDDGDYKSTGREDYSTSDSGDFSGEEDEDDEEDEFYPLHLLSAFFPY